ncbi:ATP-binding protein [Tahibacter sp. UC22_41]|uniref:ATP-binding protein n=1 Tax=Tahibacter sp. UC22_41 TaxID=3350178 RepID=UPI0036DE0E86
MRCLLALLLIGLPWLGSVAATLPAYVHESWTIHDGLPVNSITRVARSRDGYLWLATLDGLVRFDGAGFRTYHSGNTPGFRHGRLTNVLESADGRLLLDSEAGVVQLFDPASETSEVLASIPTVVPTREWQSPDGQIWINLWPGLGRLEGTRIVAETAGPLATLHVAALYLDAAQQRLIGSADGGVWAWRDDALQPLATPAQLPIGTLAALTRDARGVVWVGGSEGLARIDHDGVHRFAQAGQPWQGDVQSLQGEADGSLLVGTESGPLRLRDGQLQALDTADTRRSPAQALLARAGSPLRVSASAVMRGSDVLWRLGDPVATRIVHALPDADGTLWLASVGAGLHRLRPVPFSVVGLPEGLSAREVYPLHQDAAGALWIGTQRGGLNRYQDGRIDVFGSAQGLLDDNIQAIASDADGALWVATREAGLFRRDSQGRFQPQVPPQSGGSRVKALTVDREGVLWAGGEHGLHRRTRGGDWQRHPVSDALAGCEIRGIREAPDGALWLATQRCGVTRVAGEETHRYDASDGALSDFVRDIRVVDAQEVWIASEDRGISRLRLTADPARPATVSVRAAHGLLSDGIHQIVDDGHGWWWMSTNQGIFRVRRQALEALADGLQGGRPAQDAPLRVQVESYAESSGLRNREANGGAQSTALRAADGRLWFATQDGVAVVDPDPRRLARQVRPAIDAVVSGDRRWHAQPLLELAADARSFRVDFNELQQLDARQVRFRYRLRGFDSGWVESGVRRSAFYTKVPPGDYPFEVQAWAGGDWGEQTASLTVRVQPYFHETALFRVTLLLAALALAWLVYRARVGWLQRQRRALIEQVALRTHELAQRKEAAEQQAQVIAGQAEQLRELDQQKSRFFDDLAHELRTPLTLILGPLRDVRRTASTTTPAIDSAIRNSEILLDLTNQLLDLARLEAGKLPLERRAEDLVALLRRSAERFRELAATRGIAFDFTAPTSPVWVQLDLRHAGKIVDNLLSNAFKFTPAGGRVTLSLDLDADGSARVDVADTGSGIPAEHLPHVFERFHHSDDSGSRLQPGTGIGLALAHDLTRLHEGHLEVDSAPGIGTRFSVFLPLCTQPRVGGDPHDEPAPVAAPPTAGASQDGHDTAYDHDNALDRTTVLMVDDHADIRAYVRRQLEPRYRVLEAEDGLSALALARECLPDLIVADISMPRLDGYGLCAQVRGDPEIDWLPIILLTARAGLDNRLEGLRATADDYLTKPFDSDELRVRVDNLIAQRRRLRERFAAAPLPALAEPHQPEAQTPGAAAADGAAADGDAGGYRERLLATIRSHMADETFKVAALAEAMNQDRSHLFRRVREATGLAPSDLIRALRLERATELLQADAGPISEIAYAVGFSSVAYFTKCYREHYGRTPGQSRGTRATEIA